MGAEQSSETGGDMTVSGSSGNEGDESTFKQRGVDFKALTTNRDFKAISQGLMVGFAQLSASDKHVIDLIQTDPTENIHPKFLERTAAIFRANNVAGASLRTHYEILSARKFKKDGEKIDKTSSAKDAEALRVKALQQNLPFLFEWFPSPRRVEEAVAANNQWVSLIQMVYLSSKTGTPITKGMIDASAFAGCKVHLILAEGAEPILTVLLSTAKEDAARASVDEANKNESFFAMLATDKEIPANTPVCNIAGEMGMVKATAYRPGTAYEYSIKMAGTGQLKMVEPQELKLGVKLVPCKWNAAGTTVSSIAAAAPGGSDLVPKQQLGPRDFPILSSIDCSLTLAKMMLPTNPDMAAEMCAKLVDLIDDCLHGCDEQSALGAYAGGSAPASNDTSDVNAPVPPVVQRTLDSVRQFCAEVLNTSNASPQTKQCALALLLSVAMSSKSLSHILDVILQLKSLNASDSMEGGVSHPLLQSTITTSLALLHTQDVKLDLCLPEPATKFRSFPIAQTLPVAGNGHGFDAGLASDGRYVYIWKAGRLSKIGSGLAGTKAGAVYRTATVADAGAGDGDGACSACVACVEGKIYLFPMAQTPSDNKDVAGRHQVLVIATENLSVQHVLYTPAWTEPKAAARRSTTSTPRTPRPEESTNGNSNEDSVDLAGVLDEIGEGEHDDISMASDGRYLWFLVRRGPCLLHMWKTDPLVIRPNGQYSQTIRLPPQSYLTTVRTFSLSVQWHGMKVLLRDCALATNGAQMNISYHPEGSKTVESLVINLPKDADTADASALTWTRSITGPYLSSPSAPLNFGLVEASSYDHKSNSLWAVTKSSEAYATEAEAAGTLRFKINPNFSVRVRIRDGPSTSHGNIGLLDGSDTIEVVAEDPNPRWLKVMYQGVQRWCVRRDDDGEHMVAVIPSGTAAQGSGIMFMLNTAATRNHNVRSGPSTTHDSVGSLGAGDRVEVIASGGPGSDAPSNWVQIIFEGQPRWCMRREARRDGKEFMIAMLPREGEAPLRPAAPKTATSGSFATYSVLRWQNTGPAPVHSSSLETDQGEAGGGAATTDTATTDLLLNEMGRLAAFYCSSDTQDVDDAGDSEEAKPYEAPGPETLVATNARVNIRVRHSGRGEGKLLGWKVRGERYHDTGGGLSSDDFCRIALDSGSTYNVAMKEVKILAEAPVVSKPKKKVAKQDTSFVPYCIDPCAAVFEKLTGLLEELKGHFLDAAAPVEQRQMLLSVLRLLQANMHQVLSSKNPKVIKAAVSFELREQLQALLNGITDALSNLTDEAAAADPWAPVLKAAVTGLATEAMELFFTDEEFNCTRLATVVQKYSTTPQDVSEIELRQVIHLLQRLRTSEVMRSALMQSGHCRALLHGLVGASADGSLKHTEALFGGTDSATSGGGVPSMAADSFESLTTGLSVGLKEIWELTVANAICGRGLDDASQDEQKDGTAKGPKVGEGLADELAAFCSFFLQLLIGPTEKLIAAALRALDRIDSHAANDAAAAEMAAAVDRILQCSVLGELLPALLGAVTHIATISGSVAACVPVLIRIRSKMLQLLTHTSAEYLLQKKQPRKKVVEQVSKVFESAHNYRDNTDETIHISIPGAKSISISFDSRTVTERRHDWVKFYKKKVNGELKQQVGGEYSGSATSDDIKWPGCGSNDALVIEGEECFLKWHTDGSGTAWGWKLTAVATVAQKQDENAHWLQIICRSISALTEAIVPQLFEYPRWDPSEESTMSTFLQQQLFFAGRSADAEATVDKDATTTTVSPRGTIVGAAGMRQLEFLNDLIEQTSGSTAVALHTNLLLKIKRFRQSVKGQCYENVTHETVLTKARSKAILAAIACMLWHNSLVALAIKEAGEEQFSRSLVGVWETAYKSFWKFFHYGDLKHTEDRQNLIDTSPNDDKFLAQPRLIRLPSVTEFAEEDAIAQTLDALVARAHFLLKYEPANFDTQLVHLRWQKSLKAVLKLSSPRNSTTVAGVVEGIAVAEDETQTKNKMVDLVSYKQALQQQSQMRKALGKTAGRKVIGTTISECIEEFLKANVDTAELEAASKTRDLRASHRIKCLELLLMMLQVCAAINRLLPSPYLVLPSTRYIPYFQQTHKPTNKPLHFIQAAQALPSPLYLQVDAGLVAKTKALRLVMQIVGQHAHNHVEGCVATLQLQLRQAHRSVLQACVATLADLDAASLVSHADICTELNLSDPSPADVGVCAFQALAFEFQQNDHGMLAELQLLPTLRVLLEHKTSTKTRAAAWQLFEFLLQRSMHTTNTLSAGDDVDIALSEFSRQLVQMLVEMFEQSLDSLQALQADGSGVEQGKLTSPQTAKALPSEICLKLPKKETGAVGPLQQVLGVYKLADDDKAVNQHAVWTMDGGAAAGSMILYFEEGYWCVTTTQGSKGAGGLGLVRVASTAVTPDKINPASEKWQVQGGGGWTDAQDLQCLATGPMIVDKALQRYTHLSSLLWQCGSNVVFSSAIARSAVPTRMLEMAKQADCSANSNSFNAPFVKVLALRILPTFMPSQEHLVGFFGDTLEVVGQSLVFANALDISSFDYQALLHQRLICARQLTMEEKTQPLLVDLLCKAMDELPQLIKTLHLLVAANSSKDDDTSNTDHSFSAQELRGIGAISLLGGYLEAVCTGSRALCMSSGADGARKEMCTVVSCGTADDAGTSSQQKYKTQWCTGNDGSTEGRIEIHDAPSNCHASMKSGGNTGQCIRTAEPLPETGIHYFEMKFTRGEKEQGGSLGCCYLAGVVNKNSMRSVDKSALERAPFYGITDEEGKRYNGNGDTSNMPRSVRESHTNNRTFGHLDRVGFLVDMDAHEMTVYRNGTLLEGSKFTNLPTTLYPVGCPFNSDAKVEISFPESPSSETTPVVSAAAAAGEAVVVVAFDSNPSETKSVAIDAVTPVSFTPPAAFVQRVCKTTTLYPVFDALFGILPGLHQMQQTITERENTHVVDEEEAAEEGKQASVVSARMISNPEVQLLDLCTRGAKALTSMLTTHSDASATFSPLLPVLARYAAMAHTHSSQPVDDSGDASGDSSALADLLTQAQQLRACLYETKKLAAAVVTNSSGLPLLITLTGETGIEEMEDNVGVYELLAGKEVNGRGVWKKRQKTSGGQTFIYYAQRNKETDKRWHWWASDEESMDAGQGAGWLKCPSDALTPDKITETWQVVDPARDGAWPDALTLQAEKTPFSLTVVYDNLDADDIQGGVAAAGGGLELSEQDSLEEQSATARWPRTLFVRDEKVSRKVAPQADELRVGMQMFVQKPDGSVSACEILSLKSTAELAAETAADKKAKGEVAAKNAAASGEVSKVVQVGSKVRVKKSVTEPKYKWGGVSHESEGTLTSLESNGDCRIDFPGKSGWMGRVDEVELVGGNAKPARRTGRPQTGDRVRLTYGSDTSGCLGRHGEGKTGVIVQDDKDRQPFKVECNGQTHFYKESDVEFAEEQEAPAAAPVASTAGGRLKVGEKVMLSETENTDWCLKVGDVGELVVDDGSDCPFQVEFKGTTNWYPAKDLVRVEMTGAESAVVEGDKLSASNAQIGMRVRSSADVGRGDGTLLGWKHQGERHGDTGGGLSSDEFCRVKFDRSEDGWNLAMSSCKILAPVAAPNAGGSDEAPDAECEWVCERCTFENKPSSSECEMCEGPKPVPKAADNEEAKEEGEQEEEKKEEDGEEEEKKEEGIPERIPDPNVEKPGDWDDGAGEWEPPMIANPVYLESIKKVAAVVKLSNPDYTSETKTKVFESAHNYRDDTDETIHISIPGAKSISISFDSRTVTERRHDWVKFYKKKVNGELKQHVGGDYSGSSSNWPGNSSTPPLVIEGEECFLKWHTDGSGTDWGWKLTATAEIVIEEGSITVPVKKLRLPNEEKTEAHVAPSAESPPAFVLQPNVPLTAVEEKRGWVKVVRPKPHFGTDAGEPAFGWVELLHDGCMQLLPQNALFTSGHVAGECLEGGDEKTAEEHPLFRLDAPKTTGAGSSGQLSGSSKADTNSQDAIASDVSLQIKAWHSIEGEVTTVDVAGIRASTAANCQRLIYTLAQNSVSHIASQLDRMLAANSPSPFGRTVSVGTLLRFVGLVKYGTVSGQREQEVMAQEGVVVKILKELILQDGEKHALVESLLQFATLRLLRYRSANSMTLSDDPLMLGADEGGPSAAGSGAAARKVGKKATTAAAAAAAARVAKCSNGHDLVQFVAQHGGYGCDGPCSSGSFASGSTLFGCRDCNFDLCPACNTSAATRPRVGDRVMIAPGVEPPSDGSLRTKSDIGVIVKDDRDGRPFNVELNGKTYYYRESEVALVVDPAATGQSSEDGRGWSATGLAMGALGELTACGRCTNSTITAASSTAFLCVEAAGAAKPADPLGLNRAGVPVAFGRDSSHNHKLYCARDLGRDAIPGSNGQCGPSNGPQCEDCKLMTAPSMNRAGVPVNWGDSRHKTTLYCGRHLGRDKIPGSDGQCGPGNGPPCEDCKALGNAQPQVCVSEEGLVEVESGTHYWEVTLSATRSSDMFVGLLAPEMASKLLKANDARVSAPESKSFGAGTHPVLEALRATKEAASSTRPGGSKPVRAYYLNLANGSLYGNGCADSHPHGKSKQGDRIGVLVNLDGAASSKGGYITFFRNGLQYGPGFTTGVQGPLVFGVVVCEQGDSVTMAPTFEAPTASLADRALERSCWLLEQLFCTGVLATLNKPPCLPASSVDVKMPEFACASAFVSEVDRHLCHALCALVRTLEQPGLSLSLLRYIFTLIKCVFDYLGTAQGAQEEQGSTEAVAAYVARRFEFFQSPTQKLQTVLRVWYRRLSEQQADQPIKSQILQSLVECRLEVHSALVRRASGQTSAGSASTAVSAASAAGAAREPVVATFASPSFTEEISSGATQRSSTPPPCPEGAEYAMPGLWVQSKRAASAVAISSRCVVDASSRGEYSWAMELHEDGLSAPAMLRRQSTDSLVESITQMPSLLVPLREMFETMDSNQDGGVDLEELEAELERQGDGGGKNLAQIIKLPPSPAQAGAMGRKGSNSIVERFFKAADVNGDGKLTWDEFLQQVARSNPEMVMTEQQKNHQGTKPPAHQVRVGVVIAAADIDLGTSFDLNSGSYVLGSKSVGNSVAWSADGTLHGYFGEEGNEHQSEFGHGFAAGDVVTTLVDTRKGTVAFLRNGAWVGLAVGPSGSGASIEFDIRTLPQSGVAHALYPAATLWKGDGVGVELQPSVTNVEGSPGTGVGSDTTSEASAGEDEAMTALMSARSFMQSYINTSGDMRQPFIDQLLLPTCSKEMTRTVECTHPYSLDSTASGTRAPLTEIATFPGAEHLILTFEKAELRASDILRISAGGANYELSSGQLQDLKAGVMLADADSAAEGGADATAPGDPTPEALSCGGIAVGDTVVRGPDWTFGDDDGGAGEIGVVEAVGVDWSAAYGFKHAALPLPMQGVGEKSKAKSKKAARAESTKIGVRVKWGLGSIGTYRHGAGRQIFDIKRVKLGSGHTGPAKEEQGGMSALPLCIVPYLDTDATATTPAASPQEYPVWRVHGHSQGKETFTAGNIGRTDSLAAFRHLSIDGSVVGANGKVVAVASHEVSVGSLEGSTIDLYSVVLTLDSGGDGDERYSATCSRTGTCTVEKLLQEEPFVLIRPVSGRKQSSMVASSGAVVVGARVRVKASVSRPQHGWGSISHSHVGTVLSIDSDGKCKIDFSPVRSSPWTGRTNEMEVVVDPAAEVLSEPATGLGSELGELTTLETRITAGKSTGSQGGIKFDLETKDVAIVISALWITHATTSSMDWKVYARNGKNTWGTINSGAKSEFKLLAEGNGSYTKNQYRRIEFKEPLHVDAGEFCGFYVYSDDDSGTELGGVRDGYSAEDDCMRIHPGQVMVTRLWEAHTTDDKYEFVGKVEYCVEMAAKPPPAAHSLKLAGDTLSLALFESGDSSGDDVEEQAPGWGYQCSVMPIYPSSPRALAQIEPIHRIVREFDDVFVFKSRLSRAATLTAAAPVTPLATETKFDTALVAFVNMATETKDLSLDRLLSSNWAMLCTNPRKDLKEWPVLMDAYFSEHTLRHTDSSAGVATEPLSTSRRRIAAMSKARELISARMSKLDAQELYDKMSKDDEGQLGRTAFTDSMRELIGQVPSSTDDKGVLVDGTNSLVSLLFDAFDCDGDGKVDISELFEGLRVLCTSGDDDETEMEKAGMLITADEEEKEEEEEELKEGKTAEDGDEEVKDGGNDVFPANTRLERRLETLLIFNKQIRQCMPLIDSSADAHQSNIAKMLKVCRGLVFRSVKWPIYVSALEKTKTASPSSMDMNVDRVSASQAQQDGKVDRDGSTSVFGQAFRKLRGAPGGGSSKEFKDGLLLANKRAVFRCNFAHESGIDQGGLYRELFSVFANELQSSALSLLVRCPNHSNTRNADFKDRWNPNPSAHSPAELAMYEFLGNMMGTVLRGQGDKDSEVVLALDLPPMIWKMLVKQPVTIQDVFDINNALAVKYKQYSDPTFCGGDISYAELNFTTELSSDASQIVALMAGGEDIAVTNDNKARYLRLLCDYYVSEFDEQVAAIRKGLAQVVPIECFNLFSWHEFEVMVCGGADVDLQVLKQGTKYEGVSENSTPVKLFWQAMESFSQEERRLFLKFVWGRSRLPQSAAKFPQPFVIARLGSGILPMSHTCFFRLDLPMEIEKLDLMQQRLRIAFTMSGAFGNG
jgi:Ca2+-binding EF-hand superfamily protein